MVVDDSAIRPSKLVAAKDDREQFVKAMETSQREASVDNEQHTADSVELQDANEDVDDDEVPALSIGMRAASFEAVRTSAIQLQYNCNTRIIFFLYCSLLHLCGPLQYNAAIQVFYSLQKTCRLLAAVVKKLVLQLYCTCADRLSIPSCQSTCLSVILSVCPYVHASSPTSRWPIFMKLGTYRIYMYDLLVAY